jgi:acyl-coenzyme A synthetase/AMP-(fatty) acid ligase
VVTAAIHRLVEQHAAARGDTLAIIDTGRPVTYRELNNRANGIARELMTAGLRRGGHATVRMERGADLAIVLLAVLKAGASYTWVDAARGGDWPAGVSIRVGASGHEERYLTVDMSRPLRQPLQTSPNLPVLTRGSDTACVLRRDGAIVLVPHATIAGLHSRSVARTTTWSHGEGALDLWPALITGAMLTVGEEAAAVAAA